MCNHFSRYTKVSKVRLILNDPVCTYIHSLHTHACKYKYMAIARLAGADPGFSEGGSESIVDLEGWG